METQRYVSRRAVGQARDQQTRESEGPVIFYRAGAQRRKSFHHNQQVAILMNRHIVIETLLCVCFCLSSNSALSQSNSQPDTSASSQVMKPMEVVETNLGPLPDDDEGMYSGTWAVRAVPLEDESGNYFLELNETRLGPFEQSSNLVSFSQDGTQVVFAAKEVGSREWAIYKNGSKIGAYEGLAWSSYSWPLGLKKDKIRMQSQAVALSQSPDNEVVSFFTYSEKGDQTVWANVANGEVERSYHRISTSVHFIDQQVGYWAWKADDQKFFVLGEDEYGPYNEAHSLKVSDNGEHFAFAAARGKQEFLVHDGKEISYPVEIISFVLSNDGSHTAVYRQNDVVHVSQSGVLWPDEYSDTVWHQLRSTPDGTTVAGWFKQKDGWYVVVNGRTKYGPYESYYFVEAGEYYSLFLGRSGRNVAYFSRRTDGNSTGKNDHVNGEASAVPFSFPGLGITYYPDRQGQPVGTGLMGGVDVDMYAAADAAAMGASEPLDAIYIGD